MKWIILLCLFSLQVLGAPSKEIQEAKESLESLIGPILMNNHKRKIPVNTKFSIEACEKHKIDWMAVILMKKSATLDYKFAKGCDIEGSITPLIFRPFPISLKLKNLESYKHLQTTNKVTATIETKPLMNLEVRSGELEGKKGLVKFEADYQVKLNPATPDDVVEKNLGGEMRITEIYGKKVNIKEKIFVE